MLKQIFIKGNFKFVPDSQVFKCNGRDRQSFKVYESKGDAWLYCGSIDVPASSSRSDVVDMYDQINCF